VSALVSVESHIEKVLREMVVNISKWTQDH